MIISVVQSTGLASYTTASSYAQAFASNNTAGNCLVAFAWYNAASAVPSLADNGPNGGNRWETLGYAITNAGSTVMVAYICYSCQSTGSPITLTLSQTGAASAGNLFCIAELSGVNTVDKIAFALETGTTISAPSITTTQANAIIIQATQAGTAATPVNGGSFSLLGHVAGSSSYGVAGYQVVNSTGTYSAAFTAAAATNINGVMILALYEASSAPVYTQQTTLQSYAFTTVENPLSDGGNFGAISDTNFTGALKTIAGNLCEPAAITSASGVAFTGVSWSADHWNSVTVSTWSAGSYLYMVARQQGLSSGTQYICTIAQSTNAYTLYAVVGGVNHTLQTGVLSVSTGQTFLFQIQGNVLSLFVNGGLVFYYRDVYNYISAAGSPGFGLFASASIANTQVSTWAGGNFTTVNTYPTASYAFTTPEYPLSDGGLFSTGTGYNGVNVPSAGIAESHAAGIAAVSYWNTPAPADQYSEITILALAAGSGYNLVLALRYASGAQTYYQANLLGGAGGAGKFQTYTQTAGVGVLTCTASGLTWQVGDVVRMMVKGTIITAYLNGQLIAQVSQSGIATGQPGLGAYVESGAVTNSQLSLGAYGGISGKGLGSLMLMGCGS